MKQASTKAKRTTKPVARRTKTEETKSAANGRAAKASAARGALARIPDEMRAPDVVIGIDLGDRSSHFCVMSMASAEVLERGEFRMTAELIEARFAASPRARIALEAGGQSAWVSRQLEALGHEVLVANPSRMALGGRRRRKTDRIDAEQLARIARLDPALLFPIRHRSAECQADLSYLRGRDLLVRTRASLIYSIRGMCKAAGKRLKKSSTSGFPHACRSDVPESLSPATSPLFDVVDELSKKIRECDRRIERLAQERYPETSLVTAIGGVGALTALAYVLTLETPDRFPNSRTAAAFVGLVPRVHRSGDSNPELRISKAGNGFLRRLLVQSAHHILGPFGKPCDLRRFGERLTGRGGKNVRKRAIVAVARKLAVLMHRLWSCGEVYDPDFQAGSGEPGTPAVAA